jgi:hypothetical protein
VGRGCGDLDPHGAVIVGSRHRHALVGQHREDVRMRVPVPVVTPHADHRHLRSHGAEEGLLAGARAVVRDGERLGAELVGLGEQVSLRRALHVPREQQSAALPRDPEHHRAVVELASRGPVRPSRRRREHLEVEVTDGHPLAGHGVVDGDAVAVGLREHVVDGRELVGQRPVPQLADLDGAQHLGHAAHVIEVGMGDHRQVEAAGAVGPQPACRGVILTGVHEQPGPRRLHEEGVPLADVDGGHRQHGRWSVRRHLPHARGDDGGQRDDRRGARGA